MDKLLQHWNALSVTIHWSLILPDLQIIWPDDGYQIVRIPN